MIAEQLGGDEWQGEDQQVLRLVGWVVNTTLRFNWEIEPRKGLSFNGMLSPLEYTLSLKPEMWLVGKINLGYSFQKIEAVFSSSLHDEIANTMSLAYKQLQIMNSVKFFFF